MSIDLYYKNWSGNLILMTNYNKEMAKLAYKVYPALFGADSLTNPGG